MNRWIWACLLIFWAVGCLGAGRLRAEPLPEVTVLIYHRFGESRYPTTNISTERFFEQLSYLKENDYRILPLAELVGALLNQTPLPAKAVVITIDDGYKSVYRQAWPLLKRFAFPFTVFIAVEAVERGYDDYLSWGDIAEMQAGGADIQDHGFAHRRMASPPAGLDEDAYLLWLRDDLGRSRRILEARLAAVPRFYAVPYGEYNQTVISEIVKQGYEAVLTQDPGSVSRFTAPTRIPREAILGNNWATMEHFTRVLRRVDLPLTDLEPDLTSLALNPSQFSARILEPERFEPASFGLYVSELGWLDSRMSGDRITALNPAVLGRRLNRVVVRARERATGRAAFASWLLVRGTAVEQTPGLPR